jgi:hypothetical protein
VFGNEFFGNQPNAKPDENGQDKCIIKIAKYRDEIGDEINRRQSVSHRAPEQPTRGARASGICHDCSVQFNFTTERSRQTFHPVPHLL